MPNEDLAASPVVTWDEGDLPRSRLYDDVYFSRADGLAEARAVYLAGCDLPEAWRGRDRFSVAELGFGTGLNIAALLALWRQTRPPGGHLSIFSIEAHPLSAGEARRALSSWPELADIAALLTARWPGRARGFHRLDLPELHATLDVAIMDAFEALSAWGGPADAWFLDGFAPARNPGMWRAEVLNLVAARSAPGARVASYTVAGQVRRDLAAAGFSVERRPGFGAKRQRLEARLEARLGGDAPRLPPRPRIAIVGAGIAGASVARALRALGVEARVFATQDAGASGAPAALMTPRLDAGLGDAAGLFAQVFHRAGTLYEAIPGAVIARQAIQLETGPKDPARFAAIAASDLFEPGVMERRDAMETTKALGEAAAAGLLIGDALVIEPALVLSRWLNAAIEGGVAAISSDGGAWRLLDEAGEMLFEADIVFLCAGMASARLAPGLALAPVRGQASWAKGVDCPVSCLFGGYVIPSRTGVLFGATHDRGDEDAQERPADHARNLQTLAAVLPELAARLDGAPLQAHAAVRATTADYLPLAGAVPGAPGGLFVLSGLGSRGFALAPLLGEHLAALALGAPSPLPRALARLVDPSRFAERTRKRAEKRASPPRLWRNTP